ncbi:hypothetical protein HFN_0798 [Helicobacter fennelliae MRY12-0050]|uniref:Uncharacterized protein n=1 Tax=Helicobacter fennelliae MRY12-0050 TaxID=1325130 RepID=T1DWE8_9HELI|nr:hypothetical protein HFN_0798 [Helicobacter fennelliae MRY12-0050]
MAYKNTYTKNPFMLFFAFFELFCIAFAYRACLYLLHFYYIASHIAHCKNARQFSLK